MRPALVVLGWGILLLVLALPQFAFRVDDMSVALGFGGALFVVALAVIAGLALRRRGRGRRPPARGAEPIPDLSLPTIVVALGISAAVVGAQVGLWLILIGAGTVALGTAGLVRELRAERRAERQR